MGLTGQPVRVIYAKLTSTGAYDVVAKTSNIALERARTLAEKLLPGNPPLDARVEEEITHAVPQEGGHVVLRFARYNWSDGTRGDVYITDLIWISDEDFRRARNHAFALVPRTDAVFDVLTELPEPVVTDRSAADDAARIAELRDVAAEARAIVASAAAAAPVLLVHGGDRARALELFTLLLAPALRARLTFQTQAFRVPASLPRITLVDRPYSNLRDAAWTVLPSVDVDVPAELAGQLVSLADEPDTLALVHELYDDACADTADLRAGIVRLTRIAPLARTIRARDAAGALRLLAASEPPERAAGMTYLRAATDSASIRDALARLQRDRELATHVAALVHALDPDAADAGLTAALVDALPDGAPHELVAALAERAARHDDLSRVIVLVARDARALAPRLAGAPGAAGRIVAALGEVAGPRRDLAAAARLLDAARAVGPALSPDAAAALHRMCARAVEDALARTPATTSAVTALRQVQDASAAYAAAHAGAALPALLAPHELARPDAAATALASAQEYGEEARAVIGAALLTRAWDAHARGDEEQIRTALSCATPLLESAGGAGRELARRTLAELGGEHELVLMPGAERLLYLLGGDAQQTVLVNRVVSAIRSLSSRDGEENGVRELAAAVLAAHGQRTRITPHGDVSRRVVDALSALRSARADRDGAGAIEVCLELLSVITDPPHMAVLEDAAVGSGMAVRLQRLDRSVAYCRAAEAEDRYEQYALALESAAVPLDPASRERLRDALGTQGLKRRLLRVVSSVIERDAP